MIEATYLRRILRGSVMAQDAAGRFEIIGFAA